MLLEAAIATLRKRDTSVTWCPICDNHVSVIETEDGELICGGDYQDNPGCGCILNKTLEERLQCG